MDNSRKENDMEEPGKTPEELIEEIKAACGEGGAIFRGEPKEYEKYDEYAKPATSSIYRKYKKENLFGDHFQPVDIEEEIVQQARATRFFSQKTPIKNILTDLRHFGGDTALIDFSHCAYVALFFACNGQPEKDGDGRVIVLSIQNLKEIEDEDIHNKGRDKKCALLVPAQTKHSRDRTEAQHSIFVHALEGFIPENMFKLIKIPQESKRACLEYLNRFHNIRQNTIYNDLIGYIANEKNFETAQVSFYRGNSKAALGLCEITRGGNHEIARGWHEKAIADYDEALRLNPGFAAAFVLRGNSKAALGRHDEAIADYDEAIRLNPEFFAAAFIGRGNSKADLDRHDEAIADYDEALRLNPRFATAFSGRGRSKAALGRHDEAIADYDEALRLTPEFAAAFVGRGYSKAALGQYDAAIADFEKGCDLAKRQRNEKIRAFAEKCLQELYGKS